MNGVNQILVIAVGALILLGLMGAVGDANSGFFGTVVKTVEAVLSSGFDGGGGATTNAASTVANAATGG